MIPLKSCLRLLLLSLAFLTTLSPLSAGSVLFNYNIPPGSTYTSAGVFSADGTLLRTLWSNDIAVSGDNTAIWDGLDDEGQPIAPGSYTIKVLYSQVSYTWEGTIGNTSTMQTGTHVRRPFEPLSDLAITGGNMFFANGYNEGKPLYNRSSTSEPNDVTHNSAGQKSLNSDFVGIDDASVSNPKVYFANSVNSIGSSGASFIAAYTISNTTGNDQRFLYPLAPTGGGENDTYNSQAVWNGVANLQYADRYDTNKELTAKAIIELTIAGRTDVTGLTGKEKAPTGFSVQKKGGYMFASHYSPPRPPVQKPKVGGVWPALIPAIEPAAYLDEVRVFDKANGKKVDTVIVEAPGRLAATTSATNPGVWIICTEDDQRVVRRYDVASNGTLTMSTAVITGLTDPLAVAVSPDNATLLVADGGTSQQVKAFNNATTGAQSTAIWTLGQAGGYPVNGATVYPSKGVDVMTAPKFMFRSINRSDLDRHPFTYLAFQDDGSFWVGDPGNQRILHFDGNRNYVNEIMYISHSYMTTVSYSDPQRVFVGWMEFAVDYNALSTDTGGLDAQGTPLYTRNAATWKYVRNWSAQLSDSEADAPKYGFTIVRDLGGRTFGVGHTWVYNAATKAFDEVDRVYELQSNHTLRDTGILLSNTGISTFQSKTLHEDGSLRWADVKTDPAKAVFYKSTFAGLDGSNNPTWSTAVVAGSNPINSSTPIPTAGFPGNASHRFPSTTSGKIVYADGSDARFHLGAVAEGGTTLKWRTASSGRFFDKHGTIGTIGGYPNNGVYTNGNHIVLAAHGEGAKDIYLQEYQAGQYLHYREDGLMIGQFGRKINYLRPNIPVDQAGVQPGTSGNALASAFVSFNSNLYYWHCDEGQTSGVHRWKINNPTTVAERTISVTLPAGSNGTGITGQYFNGTDPENYVLVTSGNDEAIDFNWINDPAAAGVTIDNFSVRWTGLIEPKFSENYTFTIAKGDKNNARLLIRDRAPGTTNDGWTKVVDGWTSTGTSISGSVTLEANKKYSIMLEYRDPTIGDPASVALKWSSPTQPLEVVPFSQLYPSDTMAINFGDVAVGRFEADPYLGTTGTVTSPTTSGVVVTGTTVDTSGVTAVNALADLPPQAVLQKARQFNFRQGILDLAPSTQYRVLFHLAEIGNPGANPRLMDFAVPEISPIESAINVSARAGAANKAVIVEKVLSTDNAGQLRISLETTPPASGKPIPLINALELFRAPDTDAAFASIGSGNGLKAEYFNGTAFAGTPTETRVDPDVNFSWSSTNLPPGVSSSSSFSASWSGEVLTARPGIYKFEIRKKGTTGVRLTIDGVSVIDQLSASSTEFYTGSVNLGAASSRHSIKLDYVQSSVTGTLSLKWIQPPIPPSTTYSSLSVIVPRSQLYTNYTPAATEVIVDNPDLAFAGPGSVTTTVASGSVTTTGAWAKTTGTGVWGASFLHDSNSGKGLRSVQFTPTLPSSGTYKVYARWVANTNRPTNTPFSIVHADGTTTAAINQQVSGGSWVLIGSYRFTAGTAGSVTISNTGTSGYVIADAVKFVKQ